MRNKSTPTAIHKTKRAGYHSDGGGLYLRVTRAGTRSWIFRWRNAERAARRAAAANTLTFTECAGRVYRGQVSGLEEREARRA